MIDYYYQHCHNKLFKYILFPALQGALYIKKWLCPTEDITESDSDDKETFEVLEGKLIGKDKSFTHTITDKNLDDIKKGMNVIKLTKILCYLEDIPFNDVEILSIDFICDGDYVSKDYTIEMESTDVI